MSDPEHTATSNIAPPPIGVHVVKVWNHAVWFDPGCTFTTCKFCHPAPKALVLVGRKINGVPINMSTVIRPRIYLLFLSRVPVPTRYGHGCRGYNLFSRPHRRGHDSIPILAAVPRQPDLNETSTRRHCRGVEFNVISQSINLIYGGTSPSFCCRGGCTIGKGVISWIIHHDIRVDFVQDLLRSGGGILYLNEAMVLRRGRLEKLARLAKIVNLSRISQTGGGKQASPSMTFRKGFVWTCGRPSKSKILNAIRSSRQEGLLTGNINPWQ